MTKKTLSVAISPCPNDTFVFDALLHNKTYCNTLFNYTYHLADIEQLNQGAIKAQWDMVKISCASYHLCHKEYMLLRSGAAMGISVGPLLIAKHGMTLSPTLKIASPGKHSTAYRICKDVAPEITHYRHMPFHQIENAVLDDSADAGIIIHESRFTYQQKGLVPLLDLGGMWEKRNRLPVPLGCILLKRKHQAYAHQIEQCIQESVTTAQSSLPSTGSFVTENAQEMNPTVMKQHIKLYVNDYTLDMKEEGLQAIQKINLPNLV